MEYFAKKKKKERNVLIHATVWVNLEKTMIIERRQSQCPNITGFHLYEISRIG
jgi:hypothetical protein